MRASRSKRAAAVGEPAYPTLLDLATESTFGGKATLVLSGRVDHCDHLAAKLCEDDVAAAAAVG